jgi:hypothetical protein
VADMITHDYYIGRKLKDLIDDINKKAPHALNYYIVQGMNLSSHLPKIQNNEDYREWIIESISDLASDYTYWIIVRHYKGAQYEKEMRRLQRMARAMPFM